MRSIVSVGQRDLGTNLANLYRRMVRQKGLLEGESEFKTHMAKFHRKVAGKGRLKDYHHFSFKGLAEGIFQCEGMQLENKLRQGGHFIQRGLLEANAAVDLSAFSNITGQIMIDRVRDNYESPEFITDQLFETIPVTGGNLGPHLEPWISRIKDDPSIIQQQGEYPETEFDEQYITLVAPVKRGYKVSLTMELLFADKTKQVMKRCDDLGHRMKFFKEERGLRFIIGTGAAYNNFTYMGTTYNTYGTSGLWVNDKSGNQILDYKGITPIEFLFSNMVDFVTGKSIEIDPHGMRVLCVPEKLPELKIAFHAARTRQGQFPTSGSPTNAQPEYEGVPLINDVDYQIMSSKILYRILLSLGLTDAQAKEYVWIGNFPKAFYWREATPFTTEQAPPGNPAEFNQDIVVQVKAREWGDHGVQGPQQVVRSYNT